MKKNLLTNLLFLYAAIPSLLFAQPVVIMDAGSSGTRLHYFDTQAAQNDVQTKFSIKAKPGIASYIQGDTGQQSIDNAGLKQYLNTLISQAKQQGLTDLNTPVYLYATAGMRLQDQATQTQLMQAAKDHLQAQGFTNAHSTVIDGQHEALYGWLNANQNAVLKGQGKTKGMIDMGGASTEIAFDIKRHYSRFGEASDRLKVKINNKNYTVFAKSYLGLGKDQARANIKEHSPLSQSVCFPAGTWSDGSAAFNWDQCHGAVSTVFSPFESIPLSKRRNRRSTPKQFLATSALYYSAAFLKQEPFNSWPQKTKQLCAQDWSTLQEQYPDTPEQFLKVDCISAVYGHAILIDLFKLQNKTVGFGQSDWASGAAIAFMLQHDMPG